jgi:hypothetical protein
MTVVSRRSVGDERGKTALGGAETGVCTQTSARAG